MMLPDKIYCGNNGHGNLSYSQQKVLPQMKEYIRKDAILEWANKKKAELLADEPSDVAAGMYNAFSLLIFKLETL